MRQLIITADDFGLSVPLNEAVEEAHRRGMLTAASLMMGAPALEDALARARRLPRLAVGLHLVLLHGRPVLDAREVPDLVAPDGRFGEDPVRLGVRLYFSRDVQRQAEAELRAQFERYLDTGLRLDHVDGHLHFHQHPFVVDFLARSAVRYGVRAVRIPAEPFRASWRAQRDRSLRRLFGSAFGARRLARMRARLRAAGIRCNDRIFGLHDSGRMTPERLARFVARLPAGVSEIYCHPGTRRWSGPDNLPEGYLCVEEFRALVDPSTAALARANQAILTSYGELGGVPIPAPEANAPAGSLQGGIR